MVNNRWPTREELLPVSCVDWGLERMKTKTKTLLTSQVHKYIDPKSNTRSQPHAIALFSTQSLYSQSILHTSVYFGSLQGDETSPSQDFIVASLLIFYFRSCSALSFFSAVSFLLLAQLYKTFCWLSPTQPEKNRMYGHAGVPAFTD